MVARRKRRKTFRLVKRGSPKKRWQKSSSSSSSVAVVLFVDDGCCFAWGMLTLLVLSDDALRGCFLLPMVDLCKEEIMSEW